MLENHLSALIGIEHVKGKSDYAAYIMNEMSS